MSTPSEPSLPPLRDLVPPVRLSADDSQSSPSSPLAHALSLLFEPSPVLINNLVPDYARRLANAPESNLPETYAQLIDQALVVVHGWSWANQADFVGGHPRIGEVKGLSALSAAEQGQRSRAGTSNAPARTPPEVLARLAFLNAAYERRYPGLVYITFVDGRSRAQIRDEMEDKLRAEGVLPSADDDGGLERIVAHRAPSDAWCKEVQRAVDDVGRIAKSRLTKLGID